jgi:methionyl-tRNA synthetase
VDSLDFNRALGFVWEKISALDERIQQTQPFKLVRTDKKQAGEIVKELATGLFEIALMLEPFMPETAGKIKQAIKENKMPEPLFLRKG